jgi:predicted oxidoreductase
MGADVIVLEKRETLGGNSAFAEGLFAAESPAQKRMNIDARRDEAFKIAMSYAGVGYVQCNPQWQHLGFRDQLWTDCR